MSKSISSEQTTNGNLNKVIQKDFGDLSTTEIQQLMQEGVRQARKRMHDKNISTIISVDGNIYEEHPDGKLTSIDERSTK